MVRGHILMLGALAGLAMAEPPPLRLNPMSRATAEQLRVLGRAPTPFELNWGIFVEWSEILGGLFQLSVPEAIYPSVMRSKRTPGKRNRERNK